MSPNNNFNILAWYDSIDQQNHRKAYVYGTIWGLIAPNNSILPFQFVSPGSLGSVTSVVVKSLETNGSVDLTSKLTISVTDYVDDDGNAYSIVMHKGDDVLSSKLSEGRHYIELKQGSKTWYSEVFTVVSNIDCYIKLEYWDNSNLYFKCGHIEYLTGFKFVCYLSTEIGKPTYPFEEELTERDGYKFIEKQTSSKVYNMTFHAPEFMCDALRLVRMCDNIHITNHGKVYRALSFSVSVDWEDNGDVAAVDAEFETDTVVTKIANILNGPSESGSTFNDALLYEKSSPLMFDEGVVAQYTRTVQVTVEAQFVGKLIRELDEYLSEQIPETAYIAIDLGDGPALKMPLSKIADKYWNYVSSTAEDYLIPKTAKHVFSNMDVVAYATGKYDIVLPIASAAALGAIRVGDGLSIDKNGIVSVSGGAGTIKNIIIDPSTGNVLTGVTLSADGKTLTFAKDITAITTSNYATTLDTRYVKKSGDTMTGSLILPYGVDSDPAMGLRFKNTDSTQGTVLRWNGTDALIISGTGYNTAVQNSIYFRPLGTASATDIMAIRSTGLVEIAGSVRATGDVVAYSTGPGDITLPIASANALGAVKIGDGLSISTDGTLSANNTGTIGGVQSSGAGNVVTGLDVISGGKVLLYTKGLTALTTTDYATTLDTRYVKKSGDIMTGALSFLSNTPYILFDNTEDAGSYIQWNSNNSQNVRLRHSGRDSEQFGKGLILESAGAADADYLYLWIKGGRFIADKAIISNIATGTAPLSVSSTTVCANLNADMLDGLHATSFYRTYTITVGGSQDYFYPLVWVAWTPYPDITIQSPSFDRAAAYNCNIIRFRLSADGWSDVPRWCNVEFNRRYQNAEVTIDSIWYGTEGERYNAVYVRGGLTYTIAANVTLEAKLSNFTAGQTIFPAGVTQSAIAPTNATKAWSYSTGSHVTYDHIVGISDIVSQGDVIAYSTGSGDIVLPIASSSALGAIKVGSGLSIAPDGTLSAIGSGSVGNIVINPASGNVITNAALSSDGKTITFTKDLVAWHSGNDGSGSGLDADLLDGLHNGEVTAAMLKVIDTRSVQESPADLPQGLETYFKFKSTVGISGVDFTGILSFRPWYDFTGGPVYQVAFADSPTLYVRQGTSSGWGGWITILDSSNYARMLDGRYVNVTGDTMTGTLTSASTTGSIIFKGTESNDITNIYTTNGTLGDSPLSIRNGLRFNWYSTYWYIGNIRGNSSDSAGFGIANESNKLYLQVTPNNTIAPAFKSTVTTGSAPFIVSSSTVVNNLNADMIDGYHASSFIAFMDHANYLAARFLDPSFATLAYNKYIEWWQNNSGWFNFELGNLKTNGHIRATGDVIAYSTGTSNAPFKYWRPNISQGVLSWVNDTSTTTPSSVTIVGQGTTYQWSGRSLKLGTINAAGKTEWGTATNLTGQGLKYEWSGTRLRIGTIAAGEGTTSWGSYVNLQGATGPSWSGGAISSPITTNWKGQPFQFYYDGTYFICNHGGVPTLFANKGTGFNSSANIQFTASTVKGVGFSSTSDIRLKKDIETLTNILDKINNIRAVKFRFKDEKIDRVHYGVIAQEIMEHFKDVVYYDETDEYSVNYQELTAAISICGIKELYSIIKAQQSKIEALEKRLAAIEN